MTRAWQARADRAWQQLLHEPDQGLVFEPDTLTDLPEPAARYLRRVIPANVQLGHLVELDMSGEIRIGSRWWPFRATQLLRAGVGFVWRPVVGGRLVRFLGADVLVAGQGSLEFRLHGLVPVAREDGPDVTRSARGRLAAETVAWLPQALLPSEGAQWSHIDDEWSTVRLPIDDDVVDVDVHIDEAGHLTELSLERWNTTFEPARADTFGGAFTARAASDRGVLVASSGSVGWGWGGPGWKDGEFFRFDVGAVKHHPPG